MRDSDSAEVGEEEEEGLATGVFLGASAVGPHPVHDPRVDGRDTGGHGVGSVRVAGKDAEGAVLKQVEEPHVDDECGCADQTELDEFCDPCAQGFREALGGLCSDVLICGHGKDFNVYFVERLGRLSSSALQMTACSLRV